MGLSSNQVSNRGVGWDPTLLEAQNLELPQPHASMRKQHHQNQQPAELVKCPRCDSTNTKFCYYNNYNKSQPRHFCRACKRHWTKGGTLRNVPVGGGRKNKRVRKPTTPSPSTTTTTTSITITSTVPSLEVDHDHKRIPTSHYKSLICPQPSLDNLISTTTTRDSEDKDFGIGNGIFLSSSMSHTQNQNMLFPFSTTSSSFDKNPCSNNVYNNYGEEFKTMEGSSINNMMPIITSGSNTPQWEIPETGVSMGMSNYWSWEDIDSFVSTDLNVPWDNDDSDVKKP